MLHSQNHRVVEGRDHHRSSSPISLLSQGHPEHITRDYVQMALEHLQGKRFHNFSSNLFQCSVMLTVKFFLMFRKNFLCFSLCPLPLVLLSGQEQCQKVCWSPGRQQPLFFPHLSRQLCHWRKQSGWVCMISLCWIHADYSLSSCLPHA